MLKTTPLLENEKNCKVTFQQTKTSEILFYPIFADYSKIFDPEKIYKFQIANCKGRKFSPSRNLLIGV